MNKLFVGFAAVFVSAAFAFGAASPAATQAWVRKFVEEYVSTNAVPSVATKTIYSSNTVEGVSRGFDIARVNAVVGSTNEVYATMSQVTNLSRLVLAPISAGVYTNALKHIYMTAATNSISLYDGAMIYSSTNVARVTRLTCQTNGSVSVYMTKVTDAEKNAAKGE